MEREVVNMALPTPDEVNTTNEPMVANSGAETASRGEIPHLSDSFFLLHV